MKEYKSCRTCKHSGKSIGDKICMMCFAQRQFGKQTLPSWKIHPDLQSYADDFAKELLEWSANNAKPITHGNGIVTWKLGSYQSKEEVTTGAIIEQFKQSRK